MRKNNYRGRDNRSRGEKDGRSGNGEPKKFFNKGDKPYKREKSSYKKDEPDNRKAPGRSEDRDSFRKSENKSYKKGKTFYKKDKYYEKDNRMARERGEEGASSFTGSENKPRKNSRYGEEKKFYSKKRFDKKRSKMKSSSFTSDGGLTRLNKFIANAGICSRREADDLITSGVISVNGKIITEMGYKVKADDEVRYNGEPIRREKMVYVLLNKPKDFITTMDDPGGRRTVLELVRKAGRERIYPVGRLDRNTTGVLLMTNDGELTSRLTHPKYGVRKVYHLTLDKNLKAADMQMLADGVTLEDGFIKPDAISHVNDGSDKKEVGLEIHSGKNRVVRRMFEHLGYEVIKLDRVIFAGLTKKDLPRGRWRFLSEKEIAFLKMTPNNK